MEVPHPGPPPLDAEFLLTLQEMCKARHVPVDKFNDLDKVP